MAVGRSSHTMVYCSGYIYCLGGFIVDKIVSPSMERYNIAQQHFEGCAEALQAANSPTCCVFEDKYIYKFGGNQEDGTLVQIIERYTISSNIWEHIDPKLDHNEIENFQGIFQYAACCQINTSSIMIFGGYDQEDHGTNFSYLLSVEGLGTNKEESQIVQTNIKPLPIAEGFWNSQVVIQNRRMYVLQNVEVEENHIDENRRQILCFDGNKWIDLGDGQ